MSNEVPSNSCINAPAIISSPPPIYSNQPPERLPLHMPDGSVPSLARQRLDGLTTFESLGPSDSELSDLDDDLPMPDDFPPPQADRTEDIGDILPDHWSGTVPVFKPTMRQFENFQPFMQKIDQYGMKSGIVKIIPPQEWRDTLPQLDELVKQIRVKEPIKQDIMGSNGTFRQINILHGRSYNLPQWRQLCDQSEHQPPARRGERRLNTAKPRSTRSRADLPSKLSIVSLEAKTGAKSNTWDKALDSKKSDDGQIASNRPITPLSPQSPTPVTSTGLGVQLDEEEGIPLPIGRMGKKAVAKNFTPKTQSTSARRKFSRREGSAAIDEEAFRTFDYRMDVSDFTPERCEELERIYWKTLTYASPLYGADLLGSLFDDSIKIWNLNRLPNLLDALGTQVPGVNTAYLYLGMWKATFAWHLEDVDLYSINYLHFGAPKQWYSISQADARRFEAAMRNIWPAEAKACDQFLRHKAFLISPQQLLQHYNIKVNKCLSFPGEFVVTYPYGYHSGFNLGYNCAEAVNFALDSWLPLGKIAKKCDCAQAQDSVWINVHEIERRLRGEETEYETEYEDVADREGFSGLPTPPPITRVTLQAPTRKRKRPAPTKDKDGSVEIKKIKLRVKQRVEPPCCLCPNDLPGAEMLPTDDGRRAHRLCALYLPETFIDSVDTQDIVANVGKISRDRLDLKCLFCRSKRGACFQCSQKKCARSYHATCAAAAGVFVEEADVPVFGDDGVEYKEQAFEFSCRFHRTKRDKRLEGETLEADPRIRDAAAALLSGQICQMQYHRGDIFAGVVLENRHDEELFLLYVLPSGDCVEVAWKWILLADPCDYHLPRASSNALPLPTSRSAKEGLKAKRVEDDTPRKGGQFVEGYTCAEFHTRDDFTNPCQEKVDLDKPCQMWFYVPEGSTENRARFTHDLLKPPTDMPANLPKKVPQHRKKLPPWLSRPDLLSPHHPLAPRPTTSAFNSKCQTASPYQPRTATVPPLSKLKSHSSPLPPNHNTLSTKTPHAPEYPQKYPALHAPVVQPPKRSRKTDSTPPLPSIHEKYPFFKANQNRDSRNYRTPYALGVNGFTNGFEGHNRGYLSKTGVSNNSPVPNTDAPGQLRPHPPTAVPPTYAPMAPMAPLRAYVNSAITSPVVTTLSTPSQAQVGLSEKSEKPTSNGDTLSTLPQICDTSTNSAAQLFLRQPQIPIPISSPSPTNPIAGLVPISPVVHEMPRPILGAAAPQIQPRIKTSQPLPSTVSLAPEAAIYGSNSTWTPPQSSTNLRMGSDPTSHAERPTIAANTTLSTAPPPHQRAPIMGQHDVLPEVPADSMAYMDRLIRNLRRAAGRQDAANGS